MHRITTWQSRVSLIRNCKHLIQVQLGLRPTMPGIDHKDILTISCESNYQTKIVYHSLYPVKFPNNVRRNHKLQVIHFKHSLPGVLPDNSRHKLECILNFSACYTVRQRPTQVPGVPPDNIRRNLRRSVSYSVSQFHCCTTRNSLDHSLNFSFWCISIKPIQLSPFQYQGYRSTTHEIT